MSEEIVPEELEVPALVLQPFAENAIWHGLVNKSNNRQLAIKGYIKKDALQFTIQDNGIGRKKAGELKREQKHQSRGIKLIEKRLAIINDKTHSGYAGLIIHDLYNEEHAAAGTCVEIELPLIVL
jgi:sensor histidine kinase YesM